MRGIIGRYAWRLQRRWPWLQISKIPGSGKMSDAPIEIIAHGDGWRNVEYIRADVAQAKLDAANRRTHEASDTADFQHEQAEGLRKMLAKRDAMLEQIRQIANRWLSGDELDHGGAMTEVDRILHTKPTGKEDTR